MAFAKFMAGPIGRGIRMAAGVLLVLLGLFAISGAVGIIVAIAGVAAFLAGAFNYCMIAPLLKVPFLGKDVLKN